MQLGEAKNQKQRLLSHLTETFGVNRGRALEICARFGFSPQGSRIQDVPPGLFRNMRRFLDRRYRIDKVLKKLLTLRLRTFLKEGSHKARRMLWNLPIHGQRTRTNAKTARRLSLLRIPRNFYSRDQKQVAFAKGPIANKKKPNK